MKESSIYDLTVCVCLVTIALSCSVSAMVDMSGPARDSFEVGYAFVPDGDNGETISPLADDGWAIVNVRRDTNEHGQTGLKIIMQRRK